MNHSMKRFLSLALLSQFLVVIFQSQIGSTCRSCDLKKKRNNQDAAKPNIRYNEKPVASYIEENKITEINETKYDEVSTCPGYNCVCNNNMDLSLVFQATTGTVAVDWIKTYRPFIKAIVKSLRVHKNYIHFGLLLYGTYPKEFVSFRDKESHQKVPLSSKVKKISKADIESTDDVFYSDALMYSLDKMLFKQGTRVNAAKVSMLFFYGPDNEKSMSMIPEVVSAYNKKQVTLLALSMQLNDNSSIHALGGCENFIEQCPNALIINYSYIKDAPKEIKRKLCPHNKI